MALPAFDFLDFTRASTSSKFALDEIKDGLTLKSHGFHINKKRECKGNAIKFIDFTGKDLKYDFSSEKDLPCSFCGFSLPVSTIFLKNCKFLISGKTSEGQEFSTSEQDTKNKILEIKNEQRISWMWLTIILEWKKERIIDETKLRSYELVINSNIGFASIKQENPPLDKKYVIEEQPKEEEKYDNKPLTDSPLPPKIFETNTNTVVENTLIESDILEKAKNDGLSTQEKCFENSADFMKKLKKKIYNSEPLHSMCQEDEETRMRDLYKASQMFSSASELSDKEIKLNQIVLGNDKPISSEEKVMGCLSKFLTQWGIKVVFQEIDDDASSVGLSCLFSGEAFQRIYKLEIDIDKIIDADIKTELEILHEEKIVKIFKQKLSKQLRLSEHQILILKIDFNPLKIDIHLPQQISKNKVVKSLKKFL